MVDVNLRPFLCAKHAVKPLRENGGGAILMTWRDRLGRRADFVRVG